MSSSKVIEQYIIATVKDMEVNTNKPPPPAKSALVREYFQSLEFQQDLLKVEAPRKSIKGIKGVRKRFNDLKIG